MVCSFNLYMFSQEQIESWQLLKVENVEFFCGENFKDLQNILFSYIYSVSYKTTQTICF